MNDKFLYELPAELPFSGRTVIYTEKGRVKAVMPLRAEQMVVDLDMMIVILRMAGYIVKQK